MNEFEIIDEFFTSQKNKKPWVIKGIGDDGAVIECYSNQELVVCTDTLVCGYHFKREQDARSIGHKSLAASLSDIAAMGAIPIWTTLNLTLSEFSHTWLKGFSSGFLALCDRYSVPLVGGDTTKGPLCITVTVGGYVSKGKAIRRDGARPGDVIFVTGELGAASAALELKDSKDKELFSKLYYPHPRIEVVSAIGKLISSATDVSDGLLCDLKNILRVSGNLGAVLEIESIPISSKVSSVFGKRRSRELALTGGEDYELCLTVNPENVDSVISFSKALPFSLTRIGEITANGRVDIKGMHELEVANLKCYIHDWS